MTNYDAMSIEQIANHLAHGYPKTRQGRSAASRVRMGVRQVLALAGGQPGATWQHKWVAADADILARDVLGAPLPPVGHPDRFPREQFRDGIASLAESGVIRPGLPLTLYPKASRVVLRKVMAQHRADLDTLISASSEHQQISREAVKQIEQAAAAMILFTGKDLREITPAEWASAEMYRREVATRARETGEAKPHRMLSLVTTYNACLSTGLITPDPHPQPGKAALPPTLQRAIALPATLETVLSTLGRELTPRIRAVIFDAYSLDSGAIDYSTLKTHIVAINTYMRYVRELLPDHDTLDIPLEYRDALMRKIKTATLRNRRPGTKRTSVGSFLTLVRSVYRNCDDAVRRHGLTGHLATTGSFPWSTATMAKLNKIDREHRRTKLHQTVRAHIAHLDGLVEAAERNLAEKDVLARLAHAAAPGETFEHEGVRYVRVARAGSQAIQYGTGRKTVRLRLADRPSHKTWDVDDAAHRAAKSRALVTILREGGLRIEELSELDTHSLVPYTDGDHTFPALAVGPSKQDRARTIVLTVPALRAVHDLVQRTRALYGEDPLVARTDWHEGEDQPLTNLLFFTYHRRAFLGPSPESLTKWLRVVADYYNKHMNTGVPLPRLAPHQMRRMFATDLAERGADVIAIQKTLGHKQLATSGIYIHTNEAQAMAEVTEARRRAKNATKGDRCPCCQGRGYVTDTPSVHAHPQPQSASVTP